MYFENNISQKIFKETNTILKTLLEKYHTSLRKKKKKLMI
jgi:hypothetical protein